ncbi:ATP-binding protein [Alcanivorax sp. ZXX171]|nr:ATP-binding protein [Alcanivorax sp. ZXX171]
MPFFSQPDMPPNTGGLRFAPRTILLGSAIIAIFFSGLAAYIALSLPWLGVQFAAAPNGPGLIVVSVDSASPNRGLLAPGRIVAEISDAGGQTLVLNSNLILDEPDTLPGTDLTRFINEQDTLTQMIGDSPVMIGADGGEIPLHTRAPPLTSLFGNFFLQTAYALISFFIALGIWVVRPEQTAARFFALSGVGVLLNGLPLGIYSSRDLVIDGQLYQVLSALNHAGSLMICASLVSLFWVYPRRLSRWPTAVPTLLFVVMAACWVSTLFKVSDGATTAVYLTIFLSYITGLIFAGMQWRASRSHPTDRAALKWCLLAIFSGTVMLIGLVTIPPVFGYSPLVPVVIGYAGFLMVYLGLAAGLLRYRLFDVERWWFKTWLWFAAGLIVVAFDLALVFFVNMTSSSALAVSLALSGWLYFPLRQLLWEKVGQRFNTSQDDALRELVDTLFAATSEQQIVATWPYLLSHTFKPLQVKDHEGAVRTPVISDDGVRMLVPAFGADDKPQMLEFPGGGGRLFSPQDSRMTGLLHDLTRKALQGLRARQVGAEMERNRIMRDLHDDLGARLLDLVYASDTPACREIALSAIEDLRGLVDATSGDSVKLGHLITTCEGEARTRLNEARTSLKWRLVADLPDNQMVSARAVANIMRTLREAITNVIRHAEADKVDVEWRVERNTLIITIADNGDAVDPSEWQPGHGTRTIHTRTGDLGGKAVWRRNRLGGSRLEMSLPLPL